MRYIVVYLITLIVHRFWILYFMNPYRMRMVSQFPDLDAIKKIMRLRKISLYLNVAALVFATFNYFVFH